MRVLITGCAGFIGSHAADLFLEKGYNVVGVDCFTYAGKAGNILHHYGNPNFKMINLDICKTNAIQEICKLRDIECIINFAAETHVDNSIRGSSKFIHSNVEGVRSLLEVCRETGIKLVHVSTDEVYGSTVEGSFYENDKLDPRNPYSATKAAAEHLITAYQNTHGIEYIIVRPSNNFGPRQHGEKFLPTIIRNILANQKVPVYGDGSNVREWLFVQDNVSAIEFILQNSSMNQTYNISSKKEMTNISVVKEVCAILEKNPEDVIEFVEDRPGHDFRYSVSNDKLLSLGFDNFSNFSESLRKTVQEFSQ
ncbi:MAG: dTDP-glucose 4,6-dehydratase [Flammeovirgaceae bacterium]|nr:dTDP-glucose 4,6-dehydratase [Flammeovirgaceae bacterium]